MRKALKSHGAKAGLTPGTMMFVGEQKTDTTRFDAVHYSKIELTELNDVSVSQCCALAQGPGVSWIDVTGIHDVERIEGLGKRLQLHPLTLEEVVNTAQRPKAEQFPEYVHLALKLITFNESTDRLEVEHLSIILGERYVLSFQEKDSGVFSPVRRHLQSADGRIRSMNADYLAYALMDVVVDHYFLTIECISDRIDHLEELILTDFKSDSIHMLHRLRRDVMALRWSVWPLREVLGSLAIAESPFIRTETRVFLRGLHDHSIQVIELAETLRETLSGMYEIFLSSVSNRMNEIMKVLTIIATIFIPLSFVAGVYGMNFRYMPELNWRFGYLLSIGIMLGVAVAMLGYFKKKGWI